MFESLFLACHNHLIDDPSFSFQPIRTPGAVQSFGVLIAVRENVEEETLEVRQVSENATELLGLTPRYLFSLPCFSEVLPDSQVDVLWDNIQFLADPDMDSTTEEDDSPHVFLINGWGEPGSARPGDPDADRFRRRSWSCWCAAHRPRQRYTTPAGTSRDNGGLVILEFELERDTFNPLYPMMPTSEDATGVSSPGSSGSGSAGSAGSTDTSGTLVSIGREGPEASMVTLTDSAEPHRPSPTAIQPGEQSQTSSSGTVTTATPDAVAGLEGEEEWRPSAEEILESTTNRAKPLPALERIRKMSRMTANPQTSAVMGDAQIMRTSRRGARRGQGSGVGMMDVFAVMAQINEQLGATSDLDTFLNIVVGVIKDLTQFHRVLVYQFDESWNGQTVAELVDWNQTHDLYKGLHFPASDIPAQVSNSVCSVYFV